MKTNEGGSMSSIVFMGVGIVAFIAAAVLYLIKEDQFTKKWSEHTKQVVDANERLAKKWEEATTKVEAVVNEHEGLKSQLSAQKIQLEKIEFAVQKPPSGVQLPSTINFTVVERRRVVQQQATQPLANDAAGKPTPTEMKVIKKVKKQMKELSQ